MRSRRCHIVERVRCCSGAPSTLSSLVMTVKITSSSGAVAAYARAARSTFPPDVGHAATTAIPTAATATAASADRVRRRRGARGGGAARIRSSTAGGGGASLCASRWTIGSAPFRRVIRSGIDGLHVVEFDRRVQLAQVRREAAAGAVQPHGEGGPRDAGGGSGAREREPFPGDQPERLAVTLAERLERLQHDVALGEPLCRVRRGSRRLGRGGACSPPQARPPTAPGPAHGSRP